MKENIHPKWYPEARIVCACGNTWTAGATVETIHTDVCSRCHPFFTGQARIVDTEGQVDRFYKRLDRAVASDSKKAKRRKERQAIVEIVEEEETPAAQPASATA